ncbi:MAG: sugar ABC transporter permease, partial [Oscillospiraceae bacterium]
MRKHYQNRLLLFIVPALILYVVFWIVPVSMSFYYGFTDWSGLGEYNFVGTRNFSNLLTQGTLLNSLKNTVIYALVIVI